MTGVIADRSLTLQESRHFFCFRDLDLDTITFN